MSMHHLSTHNWLGDWEPHLYLICRTCGTALLTADVSILEGHNVTEDDLHNFAKKLGKVLFDQPVKPEHYDAIDDPSCAICGTDTRHTKGAFFIDSPVPSKN